MRAVRHRQGGRAEAVDHSHNDGRVRGLLCFNCNQGIGRFDDDVTTLRRAIEYLDRSRPTE